MAKILGQKYYRGQLGHPYTLTYAPRNRKWTGKTKFCFEQLLDTFTQAVYSLTTELFLRFGKCVQVNWWKDRETSVRH